MIIALYADDQSAARAALLTSYTLARIGSPVRLIQVLGSDRQIDNLPGHCGQGSATFDVERLSIGPQTEAKIGHLVEDSDGWDMVLALPLGMLPFERLAARSSLRVVTCGNTFLGGLAPYEAEEQLQRGLRASQAPWLLLSDGANSLDVGRFGEAGRAMAGHAGPHLGHRLPVRLPLFTHGDAKNLAFGATPPSTLWRRSIVLTACLVAATADPSRSLNPAAFARVMSTASESTVGARLKALAHQFAAITEAPGRTRIGSGDRRSGILHRAHTRGLRSAREPRNVQEARRRAGIFP